MQIDNFYNEERRQSLQFTEETQATITINIFNYVIQDVIIKSTE